MSSSGQYSSAHVLQSCLKKVGILSPSIETTAAAIAGNLNGLTFPLQLPRPAAAAFHCQRVAMRGASSWSLKNTEGKNGRKWRPKSVRRSPLIVYTTTTQQSTTFLIIFLPLAHMLTPKREADRPTDRDWLMRLPDCR